jgi:hypothetical protein
MIWHHWRHVIKPPYTIVDMFWHFSWMLLTSQRSRICQFYTLIWPDQVSNPHSTTHEEGTLTITPLVRFRFLQKLLVIFITINTFNTYILFSCRMFVCFWFSVRGKLCTLSKWVCIVSVCLTCKCELCPLLCWLCVSMTLVIHTLYDVELCGVEFKSEEE